ncbi:hypothetical protein [Falsiroseomonas oryzae]|uniref:hypothetical protein n=1 Tax=Falsiroseomonas oryzae TaxID=2766473 RepID=UPI0022EB0B58|nr:hypothetical protein [Roseomonas sp. MO-31]
MAASILRRAAPAALGLVLVGWAVGPATASTIVFTTTGVVTLGTDIGTFGVGTPDNPASLGGYGYRITQRFPLANATSTGNSGPSYDDRFTYFLPGGSADITINSITVTLTFNSSAPTQNYFGMKNGIDPVPRPNLRDVIYGQQAVYLPSSLLVLTFLTQTVLSTTVNLIDSPDLLQTLSAALAADSGNQVTVWDFDYARSTYRVDFVGTPTSVDVATVSAVTVPAPPSLGLLLAGLLGLAAAGRRRAGLAMR